MGSAFAPIAARRDFYEHIVFADYDEARARSVVDRYGGGTAVLGRAGRRDPTPRPSPSWPVHTAPTRS